VSFWRHCGSPSSPGRAKQGKKKKIFFSSITAISLFKKTPTPPPLARSFPRVREEGGDVFLGQFLGRQHSGHPNHVPPLFLPIKTGGRERKEGEGRKRQNKKKRRGGKDRKKEKRRRRPEEEERREKQRERKKKRNTKEELPPILPPLEPPPPLAITDAWGYISLLQGKTLPFFFWLSFLPSPCRTCTVHVSVGMVKLVTVLMHSNQLKWAGLGPTHAFGPGPAHFKKKYFFKICDFPTCIILRCFV